MAPHTLIIGAGYAGLAAALELTNRGHQVTIIEAEQSVGGLAGTFEISPGVRLEKFYHHWFTSDTAVLQLMEELGLRDRLQEVTSRTGLYYANSTFRLSTPLDLLRFHPLPLIDRIRTGLMALYARRIERWQELEELTAAEWLIKVGGKRAYEVVWRPLLHGKFGSEAEHVSAVWIWNKLKLRGSSRGNRGAEHLLYFKGGFGALTDQLHERLVARGVKLLLSTPVQQVLVRDGRCVGVHAGGQEWRADSVLVTTPLPIFLELTPQLPEQYRTQLEEVRFLGNVCLILRLRRSLSSTYWLNVADPSFPFVGVIEHTNLDAPENYAGEHIAYLSKYLPTSDPLFTMDDDALLEFALPHLQRMFPEFERHWLIASHVWRARYSQPVVTKHYSRLIPNPQTPIAGLWLSTMAQIYPEDRGTNYAVAHGRRVAQLMAGA